ncbi:MULTISPECIES: type III CRISPR-associated RAMP protein Csx7 [Metallosphaera]|uniref:CRISPR-associated protein, Csx7 family n=3 Tax=Metallosphaera TaxID=41980 RepID=A4YFX0_METS5|nr:MULTISPECIES: CRISPR-associated RAMP protein Csx7 [Metallosphaera]ABP95322.1 CRISPR-associated protein, Csx7 family [Metallosphaera sedula DSM 5348]AIM27308.1 CRISPR-associated protein, Csx7 family [Metallosphaera sedula]AKV74192.1 CRISPR-associated protein Csx7 [Metallosphaera sedula]AKV76431.1 CRISPR-associated protein Csx7 [Metallosphaera sedula]AKV78683.1 CRISPR-associated protein Csx7 [Metallosphaera sedula]
MEMYLIRKDVIKRVVVFQGVLRADSPVLVSTGERGPIKEVIRDADGNPYIPGSSWKGVFRSAGERIARERGLTVCSGLTNDSCLRKYQKERDFMNALRQGQQQLPTAMEIAWNYTCLNCKVFGTMSILGQVRFMDSVSADYRVNNRTMIAISRKDGSVAGKALVTLEYLDVGSHFPFTLYTYNLPNYALGYLIRIMEDIHKHLVQVGGNKSRGFGFLSFEKLSMNIMVPENSTVEHLPKLDDDDVDVKINAKELRDLPGDRFFELTSPLKEAFKNARISYPR